MIDMKIIVITESSQGAKSRVTVDSPALDCDTGDIVIWYSLEELWNCILHGADANDAWPSDYNNQPVCGAPGRARVMQYG